MRCKNISLASRLRHKITIETSSESANSYGEAVQTWTTYATMKAAVEPLNGREYFSGQQTDAEINTRFRIRYVAGITSKMRIAFDSRTFDIKAVINDQERNKELTIMATENV